MPLTTDEAIEALEVEPAADPRTELGIRQLMLRVRANQAKVDRLSELLAAITDQYRAEIARHEQQIAADRELIHRWLLTGDANSVKFPDVGTAYLVTRGEDVDISDQRMLEAWARETGILARITKTTIDKSAAKAVALERLKADGEAPPGVEVVPARQVLALRFG